MGLFGSVGKSLGIGKGGGSLLGGIAGFALGGPAGAAVGMGVGSMIDGQNAPKADSGAKGTAAAMIAQANAGIKAADIAARASRDVANAQLQGARLTADASIKNAQSAAMGGIIGSALGANTTTEEIKQWLPHEVGAATIQSWDLAQKWNTTLEMRTAGYSNTAIEYELSGKRGTALFNDSQWNTLKMMEQAKKDTMSNVQMFGIKSSSNPYGVDIPPDEWEMMHTFKDPSSLLYADPKVAAQRNSEFSAWESKMRAEGKGLLVDIYKNPQLGGSNLLTMKGKDPLLPADLAPLLSSVTGGSTGGTNWGQAIAALTKGENNPMSAQIKWAMDNGIVDKYGMINAGALNAHIPPNLMASPEFSLYNEVDGMQKASIADTYNKYASMKVDPKLIREETLGMGVTRKVKLNADGTIAATAMEGSMTDMMGNTHFISMPGTRLQEWYDRQSMINGMGPLFPGMMAPVTDSERSGRFEPGFYGKNQNAVANNGTPGAQMTSEANPTGMAKPKTIEANPYKPASGSTPAGYGGAPLAAGGE